MKLKTQVAEAQYELLELQLKQARDQVDVAVSTLQAPSEAELRTIVKTSFEQSAELMRSNVQVAESALAAAPEAVASAVDAAETVAAPAPEAVATAANAAESAAATAPEAVAQAVDAAEQAFAATPDAIANAVDAASTSAPAVAAASSTEMTAAEASVAALQALQAAGAEVSSTVVDPLSSQQAVQATSEALRAAQATGFDGTPLLLAAAFTVVGTLQYVGLQSVPRVSDETKGTFLPGFVSLAADARAKSTSAWDGKRNALEIFYRGMVNLQANEFDGWFFGSNSELYSNKELPSPAGDMPLQSVEETAKTAAMAEAVDSASSLAPPSIEESDAVAEVAAILGAEDTPDKVVPAGASKGNVNTDKKTPYIASKGKKGKKAKKAKAGKSSVSGKVVPTGTPVRRGDGMLFPSE